jgi:guanylate kinase
VLVEMNPLLLTPTVDVRSADFSAVSQDGNGVGQGSRPSIPCVERAGYFLIAGVEGHRVWARYLLANTLGGVPVEVRQASSDAEGIHGSVDPAIIRAWETALSVRLMIGDIEPASPRRFLTVLSGPSGAGKSRIIEALKEKGIPIPPLMTTTTRVKRAAERDGIDYEFVSEAAFRDAVRGGAFCEWQQIHGNFYGSRWSTLFPSTEEGLRIRDLDVFGAVQMRSLYPGAVQTVFIDVPDFADLNRRIAGRGTDTDADTIRRLSRARSELQFRTLFDHRVVNNAVEAAAAQVLQIAETPRLKQRALPFFDDPDAMGQYVALEIHLDGGDVLAWANLRHRVAPLLLLRRFVSIEAGFRLLENMLVDHLLIELQHEADGGAMLREVVQSLDRAEKTEIHGAGASRNISLAVKRLAAPGLSAFVRERSTFFGTEQALFPGLRSVAA